MKNTIVKYDASAKKNLHVCCCHAATYASRSGTPLEIVSKVLLRHSNLSTTQRYLGKISDAEAMRWIDNLHG
jgi:integrase/recombinase XerD